MAKLKPTSEEEILNALGARVVALRKKAGKSQNELALEMGWDKPNLRKIEKGKTNPTVKTLIKLAHALQVSVPDLFTKE